MRPSLLTANYSLEEHIESLLPEVVIMGQYVDDASLAH